MAIRKILCPIDFSDGARHALDGAARLAVDRDAELVILYAADVPASSYANELATAASAARAAGAMRVATRLEVGPVVEVILGALADPTFDLCVIGTAGRTGLEHVLLGSVAEKVVRLAHCPTLAIRPEASFVLPRHVLCATDFSPSASHAAELAAELVQPGGAITLLHVLELPTRYGGAIPDDAIARSVAPESTKHLDDWTARLRPRCPDIRIQSRVGSPGAQILAALDRDHSIDLVCMGSHGRTGLRHALLGSVAEKVVRHARCPVLVARERR